MRVLHGVTGQAGQPMALSRGLRKIGIHAETVVIHEHKFSYKYDHLLDIERSNNLESVYDKLKPFIDNYDVFHFHARSFILEWPSFPYPSLMDILLLKLHGKKVYFHFRGSEVRLATEFEKLNKYNYVNEAAGHTFRKLPDKTKLKLIELVTELCDDVFVTDPELQTYVPSATIIPRALNSDDWQYIGISESKIPLVVHAPSKRGVKGSEAIIKAVEELKKEGCNFDFQLIENVSHDEAIEIYKKSDIIIDQLRIGWYGVLACEAMALGKPVISYIREDLWGKEKIKPPIINSNPDNIKENLREIVENYDLRKYYSEKARDYFLNTHSDIVVAKKLEQIYSREKKIGAKGYNALVKFLDDKKRLRGIDKSLSPYGRFIRSVQEYGFPYSVKRTFGYLANKLK